MTAIQLLEKIGADCSFDINLISDEDRNELTQYINHANSFNAIQNISVPDEEEDEGEEEQEKEHETPDSK